MNRYFHRLIAGASLLFVLLLIVGCGEKRHKVRIEEEQREGEVIEEGRGSEMIVE